MTQSQDWETRTLKLEKELAGIREDKSELVGIRYLNYVERYRNSSYFANEMLKKYSTRVKIMVIFFAIFPFGAWTCFLRNFLSRFTRMVRFFADSRITCRKTSAITHYLMAPGNKDNILSAVASGASR